MDPQFVRTLYSVGVVGVVVLTAVTISWLLSFVVPAFVRLLEGTRQLVRNVRAHVHSVILPYFRGFFGRFWQHKEQEPRAPVSAELRRLADLVDAPGGHEIERLTGLEETFAKDLGALESVTLRAPADRTVDMAAMRSGAERASENLWLFVVLITMTVTLGVTNSFLLNSYFRETLGSFRVLPYPLPDLQASHILAVLIASIEVAGGMAMHFFESSDLNHGTGRFFRTVPWIVMIALVLIEVVAYAVLSVRMDIPRQLGIEDGNAFYSIARYVLALFGGAMALMLSALGYMLWTTWKTYIRGRKEIEAVRFLDSYMKSADLAQERARVVNARLEELKKTAGSFQVSLVKSFQDAVGRTGKDTLLSLVEESLASVLSLEPPASGARPRLRSRSQVIADLAVGVLLAALLVALLFLNAQNVQVYLLPRVGPVAATGGAWALTIAVSVFAYLLRDAYLSSRYASTAWSSVPDRRGRQMLVYFAATGFLLGASINAAVSVNNQVLGDSLLLNGAFGVFLASALGAVSLGLDVQLLSVLEVVYLAAIGAVIAALVMYEGMSLVVEAVLFAVGQLLRFLAIPGDWLRSRRLQPAV